MSDRSTSVKGRLERLEKGDRFRVDCHDKTLRVHSTGPFGGIIILDAYAEDGAQWPVGESDGLLYLGWSQVSPPDRQTRAREIGSVEVVGETTEQATLVPDGGTGGSEPSCVRCGESVDGMTREGFVDDKGNYRGEGWICPPCKTALGRGESDG